MYDMHVLVRMWTCMDSQQQLSNQATSITHKSSETFNLFTLFSSFLSTRFFFPRLSAFQFLRFFVVLDYFIFIFLLSFSSTCKSWKMKRNDGRYFIWKRAKKYEKNLKETTDRTCFCLYMYLYCVVQSIILHAVPSTIIKWNCIDVIIVIVYAPLPLHARRHMTHRPNLWQCLVQGVIGRPHETISTIFCVKTM